MASVTETPTPSNSTRGNLALVPSAAAAPPAPAGEFAHASGAQAWCLHRVFAPDSPYSPHARTLAACLATYLSLDARTGRAVVYHGLARLARETGLSFTTVQRAGAELAGKTGRPPLFARTRGTTDARTDHTGRALYKPRALYVWTLVTQPDAFTAARDKARQQRARDTHADKVRLQIAHERRQLTDAELVRALAELQRTGHSAALDRLHAARGAPSGG